MLLYFLSFGSVGLGWALDEGLILAGRPTADEVVGLLSGMKASVIVVVASFVVKLMPSGSL